MVLKIESAMMYTNNVVLFMDPRIKGVVFVVSLTPKPFPRPAFSPAPASFLYGGDTTVFAVSLPSPSQVINQNKCSRIVCIDILTSYSEFKKPAMCSMFT